MTDTMDQHQDDEQQAKYERFHEYDFEGDERFQSGWRKIAPVIHRKENVYAEMLKAKLFFYSRVYEEVTLESYNSWIKLNKNKITDDQKKDLQEDVEIKQKNPIERKKTAQTNPENSSDQIKKTDNVDSDAASEENKDYIKPCDNVNVNTCATRKIDSDQDCRTDFVIPQCKTKCEGSPNMYGTHQICDSRISENNDSSTYKTKELFPSTDDVDVATDSLSINQIAEMLENGLTLPGIKDLEIEVTNEDPSPSSMIRLKKPWEK